MRLLPSSRRPSGRETPHASARSERVDMGGDPIDDSPRRKSRRASGYSRGRGFLRRRPSPSSRGARVETDPGRAVVGEEDDDRISGQPRASRAESTRPTFVSMFVIIA